jgi:butyryl-CoA dehydrogenase/short/branched chain acyl-CoA dehydrogenase
VDHQRHEADLFIVFATVDRRPATAASPPSWSSADRPDSRSASKEDKLGIRASSTCELLFEAAGPKRRLLATGKGYKVAIETLERGRIGIGAQMSAWRRARSTTPCLHQGTRSSSASRSRDFRRAVPAGARRDRARGGALLVYNAAAPARAQAAVPAGSGDVQAVRAEGGRASPRLRCTFGGNGYVKDYPVEKLYRDSQDRPNLRGQRRTCSCRRSPKQLLSVETITKGLDFPWPVQIRRQIRLFGVSL